jgi:hypothetical protein
MVLPADDVAFYFAAIRQLPPPQRPVFEQRVAAILQAHPDPGPGTINAAIRTSLVGLWVPPAIEERPPRWDRSTPRYERVSRRDW